MTEEIVVKMTDSSTEGAGGSWQSEEKLVCAPSWSRLGRLACVPMQGLEVLNSILNVSTQI